MDEVLELATKLSNALARSQRFLTLREAEKAVMDAAPRPHEAGGDVATVHVAQAPRGRVDLRVDLGDRRGAVAEDDSRCLDTELLAELRGRRVAKAVR